MHGRGACMAGGLHVWQGGVRGGGHAWKGVCVAEVVVSGTR